MSGKSKNAKKSDWKQLVNFLLMFKVGGVNSPQFQFLTIFVCGQQIDIDTDFCYVPYNNNHNGSISQ